MKPMKDYSFVKGVNYGWEGRDEVTWRRELGYARRATINSVRIWLRHQKYFEDPAGYIAHLKDFFRVCHEEGFTVMPIIFNGNEIDAKNPYLLEEAFIEKGKAYLCDVVAALHDEPALIMYDVMNEPGCNHLIWDAKDDAEKDYWMQRHWDFLLPMCRYLRELDQENAVTVGYWLAAHVGPAEQEGLTNVISYHDYSPSLKGIRGNAELALEAGRKYGLPVMNTETGCIARGNPYDLVLETMHQLHIPTYIFNLMIKGYCDDEHGIFYDDGTVRDPAAIAALMGIFRNRNYETIIPESPNRERGVKRALDRLESLLGENDYGDDGFVYKAVTVEALLDACDSLACYIETAQMTGMRIPPTARVAYFRKQEKPNYWEVKRFAYELATELKKACYLL